MEQQYPRSPWYDQSLPVQGQPDGNRKQTRKKRKAMKIVGLCLLGVIVVAAAGLGISKSRLFSYYIKTPQGTFTNQPAPTPTAPGGSRYVLPETDEEGYARDFKDFFAMYYTPAETSLPDSNLMRAAPDTDFRLEPASAAGLERLSLQALYAKCAGSVVGIRAVVGRGGSSSTHWGSGFIVSSDGFIITNQHVISEAEVATVVLPDGMEYDAVLIGEDAQTDVALLKIAARDLPALPIGDSTELVVGDDVVAIGNPLSDNLSGTMTNGIVSAIDRSISYNGHEMPLIQTNTALNEGNSGGPLFNMYGQVVGITNMKMSAAYSDVSIEGIGFAIPTTTVKTVTDQLIAQGKYVRPGLGITVGAIPADAAEHYGLPQGLYISAISDGSDAQEKGVQVGDILTHVNGIPVRKTTDVLTIRDAMAVKEKMTLTLYRDGETFDVVIELRELGMLY